MATNERTNDGHHPDAENGALVPVPLEEWMKGSVDALVEHLQPALTQFIRERVGQSLAEAIHALADNFENIVAGSAAWKSPGLPVSEPTLFREPAEPEAVAEPETEFANQELPAPAELPCYGLERCATGDTNPEPEAVQVREDLSEPAPEVEESPGVTEQPTAESLAVESHVPNLESAEVNKPTAPARATRLAPADTPTLVIKKRKQTQFEIDIHDQQRGHHEPVSQLTGHLFAEAEEHRHKGERALALARYKEVIKLDPLFVPGYRERGQLLRFVGELDKALEDLIRACELDPTHAESFLRRGNVLADLGKLDEAIADYTYAIHCDPQQAVYYLNRGLARAKKQAYAEVIADADQAVALDPELSEAYFIRGYAFHRRCRYDEALADFNRLLELNPKNALGFNERGLVHVSKGQHTEAIKDYVQALKLCPKLLLVRYNRGIAYRLKGDYEMAIVDFSEILRRKPNNHQAYLNRGLCHLARGDFDRALPDIAQAHELAPDNKEIASRLDEVRVALKEHNRTLSKVRGFRLPGKEEAPTHFISVTCPDCGATGKINWGKLDFLFQCRGCQHVYRIDQGGQLVKVHDPHKRIAQATMAPAAPQPAPAPAAPPTAPRPRRKKRSDDYGFQLPAIPWKRLATAAVVLLLLSPVYLLFAYRSEPVRKWQRFSVPELCTTFQYDAAKRKQFEEVEIEVRGLVQANNQEEGGAVLVLGTKDGDERVVCQLDTYALSTKRLLPVAQMGKYVIVKGTIAKVNDEGVNLAGVRIALVFDQSPTRGLTVGDRLD
ncbi:MAG: tetratricopeptide repeat protein [Gemmataceae bacterium]